MRKTVTALFLVVIIPFFSFAQSIGDYSFTPSTETYSPLVGGISPAFSLGTPDEGYINDIPIEFTFTYLANEYTTLSASTNGFLVLGQSLNNAFYQNNLANTSNLRPRPIIAPLWDDLNLQVSTNFSYKTTGDAPNRVFTAEWLSVKWSYSASSPVISFQVRLSENDGSVSFIYRDEGANVVNGTASIGISGGKGSAVSGVVPFLSLNSTGSTPSVSATTETNNLNTKPASGQVFSFTPPATPAIPGDPVFSAMGGTACTIQWDDNATNENGYKVFQSTDGSTFNLIASLPANSTSFHVVGLSFNTLYYWKIAAWNSAHTVFSGNSSLTMNPPSMSGVLTIGGASDPDFPDLTSAFEAVTTFGLAGDIQLILQPGYSSLNEVFPLAAPSLYVTGGYQLTLFPAIPGLVIQSKSPAGTLKLDGVSNLIIDGRVNASGTEADLVIDNDSTGYAIQFINGSSQNLIEYCIIKGSNKISDKPGTICFYTSSVNSPGGNRDNTIDHCDISDGQYFPTTAVYSEGSAGKDNKGNVITHCNISDFWNPSLPSNGIYLNKYSTGWNISANSFYQTGIRTATTANYHKAINLTNDYYCSVYESFTIEDNFIGGSGPGCSGNPWTVLPNTVGNGFYGIVLVSNNPVNEIIRNNVIRNFLWNSSRVGSAQFPVWGGIKYQKTWPGKLTLCGNIIGDTTGTGSISISANSNQSSYSAGICIDDATLSKSEIQNNGIGAVSILPGVSAHSFTAIELLVTGEYIVSGNLIGSNGTLNSLWINTGVTLNQTQTLTGISKGRNGRITLENNRISGLVNNYPSNLARNQVIGISTNNGETHITGNFIAHLNNNCGNSAQDGNACVIGIKVTSDIPSRFGISKNTIHSLVSTFSDVNGKPWVTGICLSGHAGSYSKISGNLVHSFDIPEATRESSMVGILLMNGNNQVDNNMVRLGIKGDGTGIQLPLKIYGLVEQGGDNNFYFNSLYIGGQCNSDSTETASLYSSHQTPRHRFLNNIFFNNRSNTGPSGWNYAIRLQNTSGLLSDYNVFYAPQAGGVLYGEGSLIKNTMQEIRESVTSQELHSCQADPGFKMADGELSLVDLHIRDTSVVAGAGLPLPAIPYDFDGQGRNNQEAIAIGADEGNFTGKDLFTPVFSWNPVGNTGQLSNRTFTAVISDVGTGVPVSGPLVPRVYFRRNGVQSTPWASTPGTLISGDGKLGKWSFTIDYTLLDSAFTLQMGDTIQYYLVAQDQAAVANIWYSPFTAASHTDVNVQLSPPADPCSYRIVAHLPDTLAVGQGQDFSSLTKEGGLFQALKTSPLTANTIIFITSDLEEDGTYSLEQWPEDGPGNYQLIIRPADTSTSERIISGSAASGLIKLEGVCRVTLDGNLFGISNVLIFRNIHSTAPTFLLEGGASMDTIKNCLVEGGSAYNTNGIIQFADGINQKSNCRNGIIHNVIKNRVDSLAGLPFHGIYSVGGYFAVNQDNTIDGNEILNVRGSGITLADESYGSNWRITGNSFYNNLGISTDWDLTLVQVSQRSNAFIGGNYFGGTEPLCSGQSWTFSAANAFRAIYVTADTGSLSSIQNNRISNIEQTNTGAASFSGIVISNGNADIGDVQGNFIGNPSNPGSIVFAGYSGFTGISVSNFGAGRARKISNNLITNISGSNAENSGDVGFAGITVSGNPQSMPLTNEELDVLANVVSNIHFSAVNTTGSKPSIRGIQYLVGAENQRIERNLICGFYITGNTLACDITGAFFGGFASSGLPIHSAGTFNRNVIKDLVISYGLGSITGISVYSGKWTVCNNFITINSNENTTGITGIDNFRVNDSLTGIYFNTVLIGGNNPSSISPGYSLFLRSGAKRVVKNNLFINTRVSNNHAVGLSNIIDYQGDYNDYYLAAGILGIAGGVNAGDLAAWKNVVNSDNNSSAVEPFFVFPDTGDLHLQPGSNAQLLDHGIGIQEITEDIDGNPRDPATPDPGADETEGVSFSLSGRVRYMNTAHTPIPNVTVYLKNSQQTIIDTATTDVSGICVFPHVEDGTYSFSIVCSLPWGGGNAVDALSIMRDFTGIFLLSGLFKKVGDTDHSGALNAADALQVMRRFTQQITSFPSGNWMFEDPVIQIAGSDVTVDVGGLCTGDVNGSWIP
ncbi:MAG: hypothetical protein NTU44_03080 [Bacteroidetes bacterium]|nr:hypothetical protein [Bacteroidota bacterium]